MSNVKLVQSDFERVERLLKAMAAELGVQGVELSMLDRTPAFWVGVDVGNDGEFFCSGDTLEEAWGNALRGGQLITYNYRQWCDMMEAEGWHVVFSGNSDLTIWQHETAVTADGKPRTLTHEDAKAYIKAGQTPAPF